MKQVITTWDFYRDFEVLTVTDPLVYIPNSS